MVLSVVSAQCSTLTGANSDLQRLTDSKKAKGTDIHIEHLFCSIYRKTQIHILIYFGQQSGLLPRSRVELEELVNICPGMSENLLPYLYCFAIIETMWVISFFPFPV
jgi:hypothetical protein